MFRNIIAIISGFIVGSAVNMGLIMLSGNVIPPPEGVDAMDMVSLKENIHLFQPRHFIFPFLAHALGTLFGAFLTASIVSTNRMKLGMIIGVFFLIGGIVNVIILPGSTWFAITDIGLAYIPMAWLGVKLARKD